MRFSDKKVFVTGASRGIGRAIAQAFRDEGAWVIGTRTGRNNDMDDVCKEWVAADFSYIEQIKACADCVRQAAPDIIVNNAGINKIAPFVEITPSDFLLIQQVNVFAPFLLCQAAIPAMKKKGWGRIVNVSSVWGKISKEHRASYSTSKFAIDGMTLALAAEHSADGIIANSIAPGIIDTELTRRVLGEAGIQSLVSSVPAGRLGRVAEIARLVLWLASEENTYLAGQNIAIDGGFSRV
ncbi:MAG: SDR family oxidoreductase [Ignavibacteriae bacterium]|nr:SDR family oxidoreductase [Ignavibacteriota bacterium]